MSLTKKERQYTLGVYRHAYEHAKLNLTDRRTGKDVVLAACKYIAQLSPITGEFYFSPNIFSQVSYYSKSIIVRALKKLVEENKLVIVQLGDNRTFTNTVYKLAQTD